MVCRPAVKKNESLHIERKANDHRQTGGEDARSNAWANEPDRFRTNPIQLTSGLNT